MGDRNIKQSRLLTNEVLFILNIFTEMPYLIKLPAKTYQDHADIIRESYQEFDEILRMGSGFSGIEPVDLLQAGDDLPNSRTVHFFYKFFC